MAKVTKRMFDSEEKRDQAVRINKFLSDSGVCSRREADTYVEQGKVLIDGEVAVMGSKVLPNQSVVFCGKEIKRDEKMVLIALNKPQGIVCTTDQREPDNIIDFLKYGKRIYPIGRLDKDSEGLILLTNNGDIVNKILRAGNNHEKEYIVTVNKPLTAEFLKGMSKGVPILDTVTRPCTIEAINKTTFRIILTQGLNRQIRRMCEYFDYKVIKLQRIRIMNIQLGRLSLGGYRNLTDRELETLRDLIEDSMSHPIPLEQDDEMVDVRVSAKNISYKNTHTAAYKKKQYKDKNFAKDKQEHPKAVHSNKNKKSEQPGKLNHKSKEDYGKENQQGKADQNGKVKKYGKLNQHGSSNQHGEVDKYSKVNQPGKANQPGKTNHHEKTNQHSKWNQSERSNYSGKADQSEKSNQYGKVKQSEKTNQYGKANQSEKSNQHGKAKQYGKMNHQSSSNHYGKAKQYGKSN